MLTPACFRLLKRHDAASRTDELSQITDEQWFLIDDLFEGCPPARAGGRPPIPARAVFEAIFQEPDAAASRINNPHSDRLVLSRRRCPCRTG